MTPYVDKSAECYLLGAMILDKQVIPEMLGIISPSDFYYSEHRAIFRLILRNFSETPSQEVDVHKAVQCIQDETIMNAQEAAAYYVDIVGSVPSSANAQYYADQIKKCSLRRQTQLLLDGCKKDIPSVSPEEALSRLSEGVYKIQQQGLGSEPDHVSSDIEKLLEQSDYRDRYFSTGFSPLDRRINGFGKGEVIVVAGASSMGKTAFALQLIGNVCSKGKRVLFLSLEMSRKNIQNRLICNLSGINCSSGVKGNLEGKQLSDWKQKLIEVGRYQLWIDDSGELTLERLQGLVSYMVMRHDIDLVCIDYLQLMSCKAASIRESIVKLTRGLKNLARRFEIPVMVLSQLARMEKHRSDKRPRLSDLRESSTIEADADIVLLLHRPDYYRIREDPNATVDGLAEVIIAKAREGIPGIEKFICEIGCGKFFPMFGG